MDKKDEIILQQLDVIRSMSENNLRKMGSDFWGTPFEGVLVLPVLHRKTRRKMPPPLLLPRRKKKPQRK